MTTWKHEYRAKVKSQKGNSWNYMVQSWLKQGKAYTYFLQTQYTKKHNPTQRIVKLHPNDVCMKVKIEIMLIMYIDKKVNIIYIK